MKNTSKVSKVILLVLIAISSFKLIFSTNHYIFLDNVNLLIHEAGHLIFGFFPGIFPALGGTINQLLIPILFLIYFYRNKDILGFNFCIFWVGDNLINISVYIKDANKMMLPLIGQNDGFGHDWNNILSALNILSMANWIGNFVFILGISALFTSVLGLAINIYSSKLPSRT
jgi:hypothetical protein